MKIKNEFLLKDIKILIYMYLIKLNDRTEMRNRQI